MQAIRTTSLGLLIAGASASSTRSNPLGEVLSLLGDLESKVKAEGEAEAKAYKEYYEWCDDVSKNAQFAIKTATSEKESLEASISELSAEIEAAESKISDLAADISTNSADLKSATDIREKEATDFGKSEKELLESIDALSRAVTILQREMAKNPAAFNQVASAGLEGVIQSLDVVVDAASFSVSDKQKLVALVQNSQNSQDEDEELGAPAAATYKTHSTGIFDVLEDLKEKAEAQLSELRKAETASKHNFEMLKQSLEDQLAADNKGLSDTKSGKAAAEEGKATATKDLDVTEAELKASKDNLENAGSNCMTMAADHEATIKARDEELKVIDQAIAVLKETSSGAVDQTYSLLQVGSSIGNRADLAKSEVVALVKKLAREHHSSALAQLASKIAAVIRFGGASSDPFAKVKGLISAMITKLESEAQSEATEKAYCDEELSKTNAKKAELDSDIEKLSTKIDQAAARSTHLKGEVKELQGELAAMAEAQASNEKWRQESHADYVQAKADLELGLQGVRKALDILRDYYGSASFVQQPAVPQHEAATGAGNSIIGILEVVESDFASNLAKEETEEQEAADAHESSTQEYKITSTKMEQDVKYKTAEFKGLDKSISELSSDRQTLNAELSAVTDYLGKLKDRCIAKPETYEQRKARREAEITGLKEALSILEAEGSFAQRGKRGHRHMRGALAPDSQ